MPIVLVRCCWSILLYWQRSQRAYEAMGNLRAHATQETRCSLYECNAVRAMICCTIEESRRRGGWSDDEGQVGLETRHVRRDVESTINATNVKRNKPRQIPDQLTFAIKMGSPIM